MHQCGRVTSSIIDGGHVLSTEFSVTQSRVSKEIKILIKLRKLKVKKLIRFFKNQSVTFSFDFISLKLKKPNQTEPKPKKTGKKQAKPEKTEPNWNRLVEPDSV
jgi:hypothetical protein